MKFHYHVRSSLVLGRRSRRRGYGFAAALLLLLVLSSGESAHAAIDVQISPSAAAPQPVGTTVTWTVVATDDVSPAPIEYQFSVQPPGGDFEIIRDFAPFNTFEWTPSDREGTFNLRVRVRNIGTGQTAQALTSYAISSRVVAGVPVVSATSNPLVALYSAPACESGGMRVRFWREGEPSSSVTPWKPCRPGVSMNFYVAGMLADTQYSLRHEVSPDPALPLTAGPTTLLFTTGSLPAGLTAMSVVTPRAGDSGQGVLLQAFLGFIPTTAPPDLVATTLGGEVLWYYDRKISYGIQPREGGTMLVLADASVLREIDLAGNLVRETHTRAVTEQLQLMGLHAVTAFHHEARPLPDGSTVVLASTERVMSDIQGPGPVTIVGDVVMVLDKNWQVKWAWDSFDHLDVARKALLDEKCPQLCTTTAPTANDWLHSNSVSYSPEDGNLIISVRHQDWVIKIDYRDGAGTGAVVWKLGKDGDFAIDSDDPYPWFSHQHDVAYEPGETQTVTVYDNGNTRQLFPNATANSRGQVFKLDEANRKASLQLNADLGLYSSALGSAQKLADGNYHFLSGFITASFARSFEVGAGGALNYIFQSQAPAYRSFRLRDLYTPAAEAGDEQTITFDAIADKAYGDAPFAVHPTASSGLPVTLRLVSGPATVSGDTVTVNGVGTVVLQAEQEGNIKYRQAQSVTRSFAVRKASQTITFGAPAARTFGDADFQLSATASSGLAVSFAASGNCTVAGANVHITGAGSCTVTASQAGNENYNAAPNAQQSFNIAKASSTTTVTAADAIFDGQQHGAAASATGFGGLNGTLPVSYAGRNATVYGPSTAAPTNVGEYTASAAFAGDADHAASSGSKDFRIAKAAQTITGTVPTDKVFGDADFTLNAAASSGLPLTFTASGNCTVTGNTVHITGVGPCTITASQAGNENYNAADSVSRTFQIARGAQVITFGALSDKTFGDSDFALSASASSGLSVSLAAVGNCTLTGVNVHITGAGSCAVTASQAGNENYNAAQTVQRTFQIAKAASATVINTSANPSPVEQDVTFKATITSAAGAPTGAVQFKSDGANLGVPVALGAGGVATLTTSALPAGAHAVAAEYLGDANFKPSAGALAAAQQVGSLVEFAQAVYTAAERVGSVSVTVRRTGDISRPVTVGYATDDGLPSAPPCSEATGVMLERCDYTRALGTLSFAAGEASKSFVVLVNDDSYTEGVETTHLRLSNPAGGAALGALSSATLQITDDAAEPNANPIDDDDETFVRQHYHDFLNREPDAEGLKFWTDGIKACGADAACRDSARVNTSGAFFLSIEFKETGFLVHRLYRASFARTLLLNDFLAGAQEIGRGVTVGAPGWEAQLAANKKAFFEGWVRRADFRERYGEFTDFWFVQTLFENMGVTPTDAEREALLAELRSGVPRAEVLAKVVENEQFTRQEMNKAFVLMQYFGYLRRDPNAPPDSDLTGYNHWLSKLNEFNGDFIRAEMVRAFIVSDEYRKRFGR